MRKSKIYQIDTNFKSANFDIDTLIVSIDGGERGIAILSELCKQEIDIRRVLFLKYNTLDGIDVKPYFSQAVVEAIEIPANPVLFLTLLTQKSEFLKSEKILIDMTCIRIPEFFCLMKYFKISNIKKSIGVAYSIPFEYEFSGEPFTSYHSYYGNLKTTDIVGYSGISHGSSHNRLLIFLGFDGILTSKIAEDIQYETLSVINNLPSYSLKYKDISMVNNYDLLCSSHSKLFYVPADNPFETYNLLSSELNGSDNVCIAPLSTKPVALGVCLYALDHNNVRVVYPISDKYNSHNSISIHTIRSFNIELNI